MCARNILLKKSVQRFARRTIQNLPAITFIDGGDLHTGPCKVPIAIPDHIEGSKEIN